MSADAKIPAENPSLIGRTEKIVVPPPSRTKLIHEIKRLRRSYSFREVAAKIGLSESSVKGLIALERTGDEELLGAAVNGTVPLDLALEIARDRPPETRRKLRQRHEAQNPHVAQVGSVAQSVSRFKGGQVHASDSEPHGGTMARQMIEAYQRESRRQKELIHKAKACEERLAFVVTAFNQLLACGSFVKLLETEALANMPQPLWDKLNHQPEEAV